MAQEFLYGLEAGPPHDKLAGKTVSEVMKPESLTKGPDWHV